MGGFFQCQVSMYGLLSVAWLEDWEILGRSESDCSNMYYPFHIWTVLAPLVQKGDPEEQVLYDHDTASAMEILEDYFTGVPWP